MTGVDRRRYAQDGYVVTHLLDEHGLTEIREDADSLARIAVHLSPVAADDRSTTAPSDFLFVTTASVTGRSTPVRGARRIPIPRDARSTRPVRTDWQGHRQPVARRPPLRSVRRAVSYSRAAAAAASRRDLIAFAGDLLHEPSRVALASSAFWFNPTDDDIRATPARAALHQNDADRYVGLWITLDPVDALTGCPRLVPGSHDMDASAGQPAPVVDVALRSGEAVAFHPRLLRTVGPNLAGLPRRALFLLYTSHDRRPR
jgi:hypothetical protein